MVTLPIVLLAFLIYAVDFYKKYFWNQVLRIVFTAVILPAGSSDYIYIYDGPTIHDSLISKKAYSSSALPSSIYKSSQPYVLLRLVSDGNATAHGFNMTYETTNGEFQLSLVAIVCDFFTLIASSQIAKDDVKTTRPSIE